MFNNYEHEGNINDEVQNSVVKYPKLFLRTETITEFYKQ
jgi:hypothetical protein